ncbi:MAG: amidase [Frankiaceae bacterium]
MATPLHELSVAEAGRALRSGELTSQTLTEHALARIAAVDDVLHAFTLVTGERALADARRADAEIAAGVDRGPLQGIPYALKDIFATQGIATTCNSRLMLDNVPSEDAAVENRLRRGGGVLLGKLNTFEFALGGPGFDLPFPPSRNPWNPDHFTGGSSAGSAVAVGAGFVRVALGTDTGGSIRGPAFNCGTIGLKPTYGRVSRRGVQPLSYSLDHCGPLTWSVEDAALTMNVIAGFDPRDPSSVDRPVPNFTADLGRGVDGLRIGYARAMLADAPGVSPEVVESVDAAAELLVKLGAVVEELQVPDFELMRACGRLIMTAEAYAIHEDDLRTRPLDYGRYTYQRLVGAAGLSAADLLQAFRARREITVALNRGFLADYDAMVTGLGLRPAARFDEFPHDWPPPPLALAALTVPFNVTGNPALALPTGLSRDQLPLGIQIVGRPFDEVGVLRIAAALEAELGMTQLRPPLDPA